MAAPQGETFVRAALAARMLGVSRQTVYRLHSSGQLPGSHSIPGSGQQRRMLLVPRTAIERYIAARERP
jgi:excisionase family DNA binding protein